MAVKGLSQCEPPQASILIVEDEGIVAKDIQQILRVFGYDAYAVAGSADEAFHCIAERVPDLVLMDIRIRGELDGVSLAEVLRARFDVPVVYLTAHADDATLERAKRTVPLGYLLKPIQSQELRSVLEVGLYRHQLSRSLRAKESWFETALRSISEAVLTVDLSMKLSFMNDGAVELLGFGRARTIGQTLPLAGIPAAMSDVVPAVLARRLPLPFRTEHRRPRERGGKIVLAGTASPVLDGDLLLGVVMVFKDVTAEDEIRRRMEMNERLLSLGTMAVGVAHEINSPLMVLLANSTYLFEKMETFRERLGSLGIEDAETLAVAAEMREIFLDDKAASERIARIVASLQGLRGTKSEAPIVSNLEEVIRWAVQSTAAEFHFRAPVEVALEADLPAVAISERKLGEVLVHVLLNAAQAIPLGAVDGHMVRVSAERGAGDRLNISIKDSGEGIPVGIRERVFEPFFTTKAIGEGTGLGLSICHGVVTAVGGEISLRSEVGRGTEVLISIPSAERPPLPTPSSRRLTPKGGRVLVVEDEAALLSVFPRVLPGFDVVGVATVDEALGLLRSGESFEAIVCDLMMPNRTGMDFYSELLRDYPALAERVIFMTGGALTPLMAAFLDNVPNPHLLKPFSFAVLRRQLGEIFSRPPVAPEPVP